MNDNGEIETESDDDENECVGNDDDNANSSCYLADSSSATSIDSSTSGYSSFSEPQPIPPVSLSLAPYLPSRSQSTPTLTPTAPNASTSTTPSGRSSSRPPTSTSQTAPSRGPALSDVSTGIQSLISRVVKELIALNDNDSEPEAEVIVKRLKMHDTMKTAQNFVIAVAEFVRQAGKSRDNKYIVRAMSRLLSGKYRYEFAIGIIQNDVTGFGRLHAANRLNYFLISPYVLIDGILVSFRADMVRSCAIAIAKTAKEEVMEVVKFVAENYDNADAVFARLKTTDCYRVAELEQYRKSWKLTSIRQWVICICNAVGEPLPDAITPIIMEIAIPPTLKAYGRGEMEDDDFIPIFKSVVGKKEEFVRSGLAMIAEKAPCLASFASERLGYGPREYNEDFAPTCTINDDLHSLEGSKDVLIRGEAEMADFTREYRKSRYYAIDCHGCDVPREGKERLGFVSFCLKSKVFFVMPFLYPGTAELVAKVLREEPKMAFRYRWKRHGGQFQEVFGWQPTEVIDAETVAGELGIEKTLEAMTSAVVGGAYCRRASNFGDNGFPSLEAQSHRAMRVTLIYEFVVKGRKLRENRSLPSVSREHRGKRKVDRETEDPSQRRHRKKHRGDGRDSGRDTGRDSGRPGPSGSSRQSR